ncbi:MAG TPA: L-seryl-tRNA(Sec) selenium transferase [Pyrinomonadaceae bacterium]|nr:L-seryl-tRNA(Sec) selenium transferase [Pyrinomonadaceae bacterium]
MAEKPAILFRQLPSVDQLLRTAPPELTTRVGIERLTAYARSVIADLRLELRSGTTAGNGAQYSRETLLSEASQRLEHLCEMDQSSGLRPVINATGVILHTNLGRAPLSITAQRAVADASGYCTIEYDPVTGSRGKRGHRVEDLLKQLTGAEDALVVNNCASAALLVLTALARDGETIVSRGELVEIGGDFRVPDVLANSGTRMVEVGTTNRTRLDDYRKAITKDTRVVMRIHPSNYRIIGFTASPSLSELATLAHEMDLPLYEDAGSGVLNDLTRYGLRDEPVIRESIQSGADVVSFSGDKLLGSAQAGLLVGGSEVIGKLRRHSLYRALRADKLRLAALEATLDAHSRGTAVEDVPALKMLALTKEEIESRAIRIRNELRSIPELNVDLISGESAVGGGSGPSTHPPTILVGLTHPRLPADEIDRRLRGHSPPVIGRIAEDRLLLDLRTVPSVDEAELLLAVKGAFSLPA